MSTKKVREWIEAIINESLEEVLFSVARGISQAQKRMDENSMTTQILIDSDPELSLYRFEAPWYQFPEINLELKMALSLEGEVEEKQVEGKKVEFEKPARIRIAPLNATYVKTFDYDVSAACTLRAKIVSIPSKIERLVEGG